MLLTANNATSTLAASITKSATTISVQPGDASKFPEVPAGDWFPVFVIDTSGNSEIMRCTARAGVILTVMRGQEGTTPKTFASGSRIEVRLTSAAIDGKFEIDTLKRSSLKTSLSDGDQVLLLDGVDSSQKRTLWSTIKSAFLSISGGVLNGTLSLNTVLRVKAATAGGQQRVDLQRNDGTISGRVWHYGGSNGLALDLHSEDGTTVITRMEMSAATPGTVAIGGSTIITTGTFPAQLAAAFPAQLAAAFPAQLAAAFPAQLEAAFPAQLEAAFPAQLAAAFPAQLEAALPAQLAAALPAQLAAAFPAQLEANSRWLQLSRTIVGMTMSNAVADPVNDITVAAGLCASDGTQPAIMQLAGAITKRTDAAWAAGDNAGGWLDGSAMPNGTGHVFVIRRTDTGQVDVGLSASLTPTLPAGYTQLRRIGSIMKVAGAIPGFIQVGDRFVLIAENLTLQSWSLRAEAPLTLFVPSGLPVLANIRVKPIASNGDVLVIAGDDFQCVSSASATYLSYQIQSLATASAQINLSTTGSPNDSFPWQIYTQGWNDYTRSQ